MYVCVYVCMYACMCMYVCMGVCMCMCACARVRAMIQRTIFAGGGVEVIVAAMRTHATVKDVGLAGCVAFCFLFDGHADIKVSFD